MVQNQTNKMLFPWGRGLSLSYSPGLPACYGIACVTEFLLDFCCFCYFNPTGGSRFYISDLREQPCLLSCMHHLRPLVECTGSYPGFLLVPCCYSLNHRHILCSLGIIAGHSASILLIVIMIFSQSGYYFKYLLISAFKTMLQCKKYSNSTSQHRFKNWA